MNMKDDTAYPIEGWDDWQKCIYWTKRLMNRTIRRMKLETLKAPQTIINNERDLIEKAMDKVAVRLRILGAWSKEEEEDWRAMKGFSVVH